VLRPPPSTLTWCRLLLAAFLALGSRALAHNPGLSSANLVVQEQAIDALLVFNAKEIEALVARNPAGKGTLESLARHALALTMDGQPLIPEAVEARPDQADNVEFHLRFPRAPGAQLGITATLLDDLPSGHRQILEVHDAGDALLARDLLSHERTGATITLTAPPQARHTFVDFLKLGIEHILTGYDHLLFLCGLLLVCDRFGTAVKIVSCFTVAHSITLAAATFDLITLSPRIVEPAIAASIIYVGIENLLRRGEMRWRGLLAFVFGLVHGLGFAGALREVGIGAGGRGVAVPLAAFNLGVETGQLAIAAVLLPVIWRLRRYPAFPRLGVPACSLMIALAGAIWFLQRTVLAS